MSCSRRGCCAAGCGAAALAGALYTLLGVLDGSNILLLALMFAAPVADLYLAITVLRSPSRKPA